MNFEPLNAANLESTQTIAAELFPWEREHALALAAAVNPDQYRRFLADRRLASVRCWTARLPNGPTCGLAALYGYQAQPDEVWLAWFGLLPPARGRGAGARMLDWIIQEARREGRRTLRLWTTDEAEYTTATTLYARRGFIAEEQPALPGEDWKTHVFSLGLDGRLPIAWSSILDRGELCGREAPLVSAVAA
jgi:GNAT superfamily N-acetyltransferase